MAFAKTEIYEIDRRKLLRMTGTMGVGAMFVNPAELFAAGMCEKVTIDNGSIEADQAGATLQFWIDGLHMGARSNIKSRANITLFMDLNQSAVSYVESVVIMDENKHTMGARYFDASMKMRDGHVPYVRFENIELDATKTYYCVYAVRSGSTLKLFTSKIDKPEISRLNTTFLPQKMRDDFKTFLYGNTANPTPGLITTQFEFYTANGLALHCARGRVHDMASDGSSFTVNIDFMHGDVAADHYMRYFIVMDPVGRLLGYHKRTFGDGMSGSVNVTAVTAQQKADDNLPDLQVANIADCPYIQFYTEDSYDAIARNMIRLR